MKIENVAYHSPQTCQANGIEITYDSFGNVGDPAILLIMGLGTQMIFWPNEFCQLLASQQYRVIRFDNRDIGKSTWFKNAYVPGMLSFVANSMFNHKVNAPYLLDDMAQDSFGLMDALSIEDAHIVGASMGGMIAKCMAIKAPKRVKSLTTIMSTTGDRSLPKPSAKIGATFLKPMPKTADAYLDFTLKFLKLLHGEHYPFEHERIEKLIKESFERGVNPAGVGRQFAAIVDSPDRTKSLKELQIPSLVIHGDADILIPVECGIATAKAIPNAKLKIFEGMGHTMPRQLWPEIHQEIFALT